MAKSIDELRAMVSGMAEDVQALKDRPAMTEVVREMDAERLLRSGCIEGDEGKRHYVPSGLAEGPAAGWRALCGWRFARRGAFSWIPFCTDGNWCTTYLRAIAG